MPESETETKMDALQKTESDDKNTTEERSQEPEREHSEPSEPSNEHNDTQSTDDKSAQDAVTIKREKDASIANTAEDQELVPIRHARLPVTTDPRYFVNKDAVVYSNATGKLKPLKRAYANLHYLVLDKTKKRAFKLEEIMVYTFSEKPYNSDEQYIFHKDGKRENCAWSNLVVCDNLAVLQDHEIARLEKLHPEGTKYAVVRNVHDTLTFERYLVSNTGNVYSLIRGSHLRPGKDGVGYLYVILMCDTGAKQTVNYRVTLQIHALVMLSFNGCRPENVLISHMNGDKHDNSLENLVYADPKLPRKTREKERSEASEKQGSTRNVIPLPSITEETRWKTIGALPWNGLSFSKYEVSDMGHVRNRDSSQLLKLYHTSYGHPCVYMHHDNQDLHTRRKTLTVPRLVASAFIDDYSETRNVIIHLNGDRLDNRAQNLKWVNKHSSSAQRTARPVMVSLVDDPEKQKKFESGNKAQRELSFNLRASVAKHGNSFTRMVNWDGEKKMALIEVLPSEKDKE
ncbi:hypothetical protein BJV82DRAFT_594411 [Fennellomyces sp. T-0311]|nr:hypothetical protein BJV82DRAFT_594411 [Fennellomyces sp. T-0311]